MATGPALLPLDAELLAQGAEARLYATIFLGRPAVVKERFKKAYRHPTLDEKLTKERLGWEARCLHRAKRCGVDAPLVLFVDSLAARIYMERVPGLTVKAYLQGLQARRRALAGRPDAAQLLAADDASILRLAASIGACIARLHEGAGMTHGDLTSSNLILRGCPPEAVAVPPALLQAPVAAAGDAVMSDAAGGGGGSTGAPPALPPPSTDPTALFEYPVTVIDFGLAHFSVSPEDRAVDLYVLERACGSAHSDISPGFFDAILRGYLSALSDPKPVAAKFEAVRQRGRKRLAFG